jgi:hypothetical protein
MCLYIHVAGYYKYKFYLHMSTMTSGNLGNCDKFHTTIYINLWQRNDSELDDEESKDSITTVNEDSRPDRSGITSGLGSTSTVITIYVLCSTPKPT